MEENIKFGKVNTEKVVLGALLNDHTLDLFSLEEMDLREPSHKKIYKAIVDIRNQGQSADLMTIRSYLEDQGTLEEVGGNLYLVELSNSTYTSVHQEQYINKLKDERARIEMIRTGQDIVDYYSKANKVSGESFLFSKRILETNSISNKVSFSMTDDIFKTMAYLDARRGKDMFGLSWGIPFLDKYTKGCQKGLIYRIGAPSNRGKSQLVYGFINSFLEQEIEEEQEDGTIIKRKPKIVFFTLENAKEKTLTQIMANYLGVNSHGIEDGSIDSSKGIDHLYNNSENLYIIEDVYELNSIFQTIQKLNPDYVFLDYIGKCRIKGMLKEKMFDEYAMSVGEFVKKSKVGWIDLSNLTKNIEDDINNGSFMGAASLRDSCDVSFHFNWFKPFYDFRENSMGGVFDDDIGKLNVIDFVITKNRWGDVLMRSCLKINFHKGGRATEATLAEVEHWKNGM